MDNLLPQEDYNERSTKTRETTIQIILSLALGIFAFLTFCVSEHCAHDRKLDW